MVNGGKAWGLIDVYFSCTIHKIQSRNACVMADGSPGFG